MNPTLRVGVSRCKKTLSKWGYTETQDDILCDCGEVQDEAHLLVCTNIGTACTRDDLKRCTPQPSKLQSSGRMSSRIHVRSLDTDRIKISSKEEEEGGDPKTLALFPR
ncbi:hypothetical protein WDU94_012521 [Cyamophila willieti]